MAHEEWPGQIGRQEQAGGDGRWQPPEWRDPRDRNLPGNWQWGYAASQSRPQSYAYSAQPSQPGQRGSGSPPAQPPYRPPQRPQRGKSWPARHKALTGLLAFAGLIIIIGAANSGGSHSSPGGTAAGGTMTASATATGTPGRQQATHAAAAARQTRPGSTGSSPTASQATAPLTSAPAAPAPTTPVPSAPVPTSPAPATPTAVVTPPTSAGPASCHPLTYAGRCYEPGEFCRYADRGVSGVAGDGEAITCEEDDGWRWVPS
jgi:hypothetical protein